MALIKLILLSSALIFLKLANDLDSDFWTSSVLSLEVLESSFLHEASVKRKQSNKFAFLSPFLIHCQPYFYLNLILFDFGDRLL